MTEIVTPFAQFFDTNGAPLNNGAIFIGTAYLDAQSNPIPIYWDDALTIPALQPIRTLNGYAVWNGAPARIFCNADNFSMTVQTSTGRTVWAVQDATSVNIPDISGPNGSAEVGFVGAGAANARTVQDRLRDTINLRDYATGDGVTNDTAAIDLAIAAATASRSAIYAPSTANGYLTNGGHVLPNGVVIYGDGRWATTFKSALASPTNGALFTASGWGSGLHGVRILSNVPQTAGSYVVLSGIESFLEEFYIDGDFNGVKMTGPVARVRHGRFQSGVAGAIRIRSEGGDNSQLIDDVVMGAQLPQICAAGIRCRNSYALTISNTAVIQQGTGLLIDPYSNVGGTPTLNTDSGNVSSLFVSNSFFDNCSGPGIDISVTGTGNVSRCRFANVWASSSSVQGVRMVNAGLGISGMHFIDPHVVLNGGAGIQTGGVVSDVSVLGGEICQNLFGMFFDAGLSKISVVGATVGTGAGLTGNTNQGIVLQSGVTDIIIQNNQMKGNGAGPIADSSAAVSKLIGNNIGYNPIPLTAIAVGASPFTYTNNTGGPINVFVSGGTVSIVANSGLQVATGTNISTVVAPGNTVTVTYTVAPIMQFSGL